MADSASGHRTVPHTADLRIEAWAPTRDGCIKEAVLGTIETFLDTSLAYPKRTRRCRLVEQRDEDLLFAVLEEVIYLLDTEGESFDIDLNDLDGGVEVSPRWSTQPRCPRWGIPKAVSFNDIRLSQGRAGWRCAVTFDV